MSKSTLSKSIRRAVDQCDITKRVTVHTLHHSFATHLLQAGTGIRTIQQLMGHKDLKTTMIYTHIAAEYCKNTKSPYDTLFEDWVIRRKGICIKLQKRTLNQRW